MSASEQATRCSILLVEDEPLLAMDIEMLLGSQGFDLLGPATSISQAKRLVRDKTPDLTILDLNLGGEMDFSLLDVLSEREIPFVVLSGHSQHVVPARHRHRPFLQKPCAPEVLLATVRKMLNQHSIEASHA
jgi:DNA-binding response OmpR family regulator